MDRELFLALIEAQQDYEKVSLEVNTSFDAWREAQKQQELSFQRLARLREQAAPHLSDGRIATIWVDGTQFAITPVNHFSEVKVRVVRSID